MRNLLLVYNPFSGTRIFKNHIDSVLEIFVDAGFLPTVLRLNERELVHNILEQLNDKSHYDTIVVSGGDGTINIVLNAMMRNGIKAKLGIIPSGTANDFATFLKIPKSPRVAAEIIAHGYTQKCDLGLVNDTYFINVFAAGLLTNISHQVIEEFKTIFGKLAYYIKGIEQIPNFVPIPVKITNSIETIQEDIYLFFVLNSAGTGGFEKLVVDAKIDDGFFDFVAIKAGPMGEMAVLFLKILRGEYLDEPNIIYFKDNFIKVESLSENPIHNMADIDGEIGPELPAVINNLKNVIDLYVPKEIIS